MQLQGWQLASVMALCAELFLIVVRSAQIQVIVKPEKQRTATEQTQIKRGMARSVLLEAIVFVPASVALVFITVRPLLLLSETIRIRTVTDPNLSLAFYGSLGLVSYGFPFGVLQKLITRVALNTLKEFASIAHDSARAIE
jgi:hypothetical protein